MVSSAKIFTAKNQLQQTFAAKLTTKPSKARDFSAFIAERFGCFAVNFFQSYSKQFTYYFLDENLTAHTDTHTTARTHARTHAPTHARS